MPVSCSIFDVNGTVDTSQLQTSLAGYSDNTSHPEFQSDLLTTVENISSTTRGLECVVMYDRPLEIGARPGESPWVKNTLKCKIKFYNNLLSGGFLAMGAKSKRREAVKEVTEIIGVASDDCILQGISPDCIADIVSQDSIDSTFGWWGDIDPSTTSAAVTGDITHSTHAQNFDSQGKPIWVIFYL